MKYVAAAAAAVVFGLFCSLYVNDRMEQRDHEQALNSFYKVVIEQNFRGAPSKDAINQLSPLISTKLRNGLLFAMAAEEAHIKKTKGSQAPLFEGPMFVGVWEGADRVKGVTRENTPGKASYLVTLAIKPPYDIALNSDWKDRAILVQENGKWVVDDLVFIIEDSRTNSRVLSQLLQAANR